MAKIVAAGRAALVLGALVAAFGGGSAAADPGARTVTAGAFTVEWSATDPEEIVSLSWNGSPNLTNAWTQPFCPEGGDLEFFGNSWTRSTTSCSGRLSAGAAWGPGMRRGRTASGSARPARAVSAPAACR